jgi:hypothetical protein
MDHQNLPPQAQRGGIAKVQQQPVAGRARQFPLLPELPAAPPHLTRPGKALRAPRRRQHRGSIPQPRLQCRCQLRRIALHPRQRLRREPAIDINPAQRLQPSDSSEGS